MKWRKRSDDFVIKAANVSRSETSTLGVHQSQPAARSVRFLTAERESITARFGEVKVHFKKLLGLNMITETAGRF